MVGTMNLMQVIYLYIYLPEGCSRMVWMTESAGSVATLSGLYFLLRVELTANHLLNRLDNTLAEVPGRRMNTRQE